MITMPSQKGSARRLLKPPAVRVMPALLRHRASNRGHDVMLLAGSVFTLYPSRRDRASTKK